MLKKIILIGAIICFVFIMGFDNSKKEEPIVNSVPEDKVLETIDAYGVVRAQERQNITIDFNAIIDSINVKNGQRINRGDTLLTLNMDDYFFNLKNKKVKVSYLLKDISLLDDWIEERKKALLNESDPNIKEILKDLEKAKEFYDIALEELNVKKQLFNAKAISKDELDKYEDIVTEKKYNIEDLEISLESCKKQLKDDIIRDTLLLNSKEMSVKTLEYEIESKENKKNKDYMRGNEIISNVDNGVVYDINYGEGDLVDNDSQKILSIMDISSLYIEADITEDFINHVEIGDEVIIIPVFDKTLQYRGRIVNIAKHAVERKGETTVNVEVAILDSDTALLPGFNVEIRIIVRCVF